MEISDEQRREVAARLRENAGLQLRLPNEYSIEVKSALVLSKLLDCIDCSDNVFLRLADLIDRPTCRLDHTDTEPATDGYPVRLYECSNCGRACDEIYGEYEYCPHCGAEVICDA